jgi:7-keto-8-aminopelargonate synthetase-like enzyme
VRAIRPPTVPEGSARLRFSVTCGIAEDEIALLGNVMHAWHERTCATAAAGRA